MALSLCCMNRDLTALLHAQKVNNFNPNKSHVNTCIKTLVPDVAINENKKGNMMIHTHLNDLRRCNLFRILLTQASGIAIVNWLAI